MSEVRCTDGTVRVHDGLEAVWEFGGTQQEFRLSIHRQAIAAERQHFDNVIEDALKQFARDERRSAA